MINDAKFALLYSLVIQNEILICVRVKISSTDIYSFIPQDNIVPMLSC